MKRFFVPGAMPKEHRGASFDARTLIAASSNVSPFG